MLFMFRIRCVVCVYGQMCLCVRSDVLCVGLDVLFVCRVRCVVYV